ncbi:MAG: AMP-binding protein [Tannerella sp.]|jgi:long-chain acyl-CoA synthetase|nr:AMP-binding protein [Tannerella sp.]
MENRFLGLIEKSIKAHWEQPALTDYNGSTFHYKDIAKEIARLHILFKHAGVQKGDIIALIGRNSSRWAISFFGILTYGAVANPILHDFNSDNVHHIVNHSEAKILLAAEQNWEKLSEKEMPEVKVFMSLENWEIFNSYNDSIKEVSNNIDIIFNKHYPNGFTQEDIVFHQENPEELALLNYTSGTTGFSKGVMIPYRSLWSNTQFAEDRLPFIYSGDNMVSMLPMAHMYGLAFEILNGINRGCHIHFLPRVPNPKSIIDSFEKIRPTLIIAVPLIIEKIVRNNIFPVLEQPGIKILYKLPIFKQIIKKKILKQLNKVLGNNFFELVIGGAAINNEVESFLKSIGFRYTVGYGMTECGPLVAYEQWDTFKQGSVGRIVDRMEVKIDSADPENEAGEIMVCGMNNMLGYYKNPQTTAEVILLDGWMRTGDLGTLDKEGFLYIRGRNKTMILSSNGQNIYPEEIESLLNNLPYVAESLVVSLERKLVALIHPAYELAAKDNISEKTLETIMQKNLEQLNLKIPVYSKVSTIRIMKEPFEKTPKQSIKRFLYQTE